MAIYKKSICVFTRSLQKGGAEKQSILLVKALNNRYKAYLVVLYGKEGITDEYKEELRKAEIIPFLLKGIMVKKIIELFRFLRGKQIKVLLCSLYSTNVVGSIVGKLSNVKYVIGGARNSNYPKLWKLHVQKYLHNYVFDYTIINNKKGLEYLSNKGFIDNKFICIPNGIEIKESPLIRQKRKKIKILSVGRFVKQKDYKTALNAISHLRKIVKSGQEFEYAIVGYGELEDEIRTIIKEKELDNIISVIIDPKSVENYYFESDVFLQTSIFEGFPNTIMEAMTYSLPIVATSVGDMDELIKENINGFMANVGDFSSLAQKLNILIESYEKRIEMGITGYHMINNNYSYDKYKDRIYELIDHLN